MPVRDWPAEDEDAANGSSVARSLERMAPTERMLQARQQLRELLAATQQFGDALVRAGLSPGVWRNPDATISALDPQAPPVTLDALLTRLTEFAAEIGPSQLAGDGGALDDCERELVDLGDMVRPLRALAQRERLKPRSARHRTALWEALSDVRVGSALDRLNRVLRELDALAPHLRPLSAEQWRALEAQLAATANEPTRGQPSGALSDAAATVPSSHTGIHDEGPADPDAPTYLPSGWLPDAGPNDPTVPVEPFTLPGEPRFAAPRWLGQRPRTWGLVALCVLLLLAGTTALTLLARPALVGLVSASTPTLTSAQSTRAAAGQLAHTPTATPRPTATATPAGPARLVVSPNPLTLACPGSATLTLSNTGGRATTWSVIAPFGAHVSSPSSGTLQAGERVSVIVSTSSASRGSVTIRWSGNSIRDRLSCHG